MATKLKIVEEQADIVPAPTLPQSADVDFTRNADANDLRWPQLKVTKKGDAPRDISDFSACRSRFYAASAAPTAGTTGCLPAFHPAQLVAAPMAKPVRTIAACGM